MYIALRCLVLLFGMLCEPRPNQKEWILNPDFDQYRSGCRVVDVDISGSHFSTLSVQRKQE